MTDPVRVHRRPGPETPEPPEGNEWLVANGLGGYSCGTVGGAMTRRFHGLLVAALPPPHGRTMMLNLLVEHLLLPDGRAVRLGAGPVSIPGEVSDTDGGFLAEFRLELGLPVWRFEVDGIALERRITLVHGRNTAVFEWSLLGGADRSSLELRPFVHFRPHEGALAGNGTAYQVTARGEHWEISGAPDLPALRLLVRAREAALALDGGHRHEVSYPIEARRGYDSRGTLWCPGRVTLELERGKTASLIASTEPWEEIGALRYPDAVAEERERRRALVRRADPALRESPANELVIAADAFVIDPPRDEPVAPRPDEQVEAQVDGRAPHRSVIAGYHWFTDWGRDTMISLEGLTLVTGRPEEARGILTTFAKNVRDGLIPNFFSEREGTGLYHTADATLWYFHAVDRYLEGTGDRETLRTLLPQLVEIVRHHAAGTRFGIGMDPADGLLRQGAEGLQLTWMDAKVEDWVVTPRRGKAVEIDALWYNALRLLERWIANESYTNGVPPLGNMADRAYASFNQKFWYEEGGWLYDVVDGEGGHDPSVRPNQILAISLRHPVLDPSRWERVLTVVRDRLLTPVGLRSLSSDHPAYQPKYDGDLRARDAAYHQGTVWGWLIGPFVDAWLRVYPQRRAEARALLDGLARHLDEACLGTISEVFDAEPPFSPRGCVAQAWSVAEFLRAWRNAAA